VTGVDGNSKGLEDTWESLDEQYPSGTTVDLISFLRTLRPHGLARSARIRKDLAYLQTVEAKGGEDSIVEQKKSKAVEDFITHIRSTVQENPHLLVAYAWTLYMAIFSGGRWIRAQLCSVGEEFWTSSSSIPTASTEEKEKEKLTLEDLMTFEPRGLSFWFFPTETDGEDIKAEFKRRLQDGEHILSSAQRDDIIKESQEIFERFQDMVADLDAALGEAPSALPTQQNQKQTPPKKNVIKSETGQLLFNMPSYAGLALVVSCVSWYAMYHAGSWS